MGKIITRTEIITDKRLLGYLEDCIKIFYDLSIYIPEPILFKKANTISWFGQACYIDNSITLSSYIINDPEDKIKPVIIHELAHLAANDLDPGCGHRGAWKRMAYRLSNYTGYDIQRTDSTQNHPDWGVAKKEHRDKMQIYKFTCPSCGGHVTYHKQTKFVKEFNVTLPDGQPKWWCRRCNKTLHKHIAFIKEN